MLAASSRLGQEGTRIGRTQALFSANNSPVVGRSGMSVLYSPPVLKVQSAGRGDRQGAGRAQAGSPAAHTHLPMG